MGEQTGIEWTDHTFNPWWGCTRVSPACTHCYAESLAKRFGTGWGRNAERRFFGDKHWAEPLRWDRAAGKAGVRRRVFCASMADVFEDRPDLVEPRARLFDLIAVTPNLDWLLLTKRPENIVRLWLEVDASNVWLGTTVESQQYVDERVEWLCNAEVATGAALSFLSCEPLLGPLDLEDWLPVVGWVITGGESGRGARPAEPTWFRSLRDQCQEAGVPFFFKQWGEHDGTGVRVGKKDAGAVLDGTVWKQFPSSPLDMLTSVQ